jgi:hypothetical protein
MKKNIKFCTLYDQMYVIIECVRIELFIIYSKYTMNYLIETTHFISVRLRELLYQ